MRVGQSSLQKRRCENFVSLRNLTTGAIWEPLLFELDRATGLVVAAKRKDTEVHSLNGLAASVIALSKGSVGRRVLAIYIVQGEWFIFDGQREYALSRVSIKWDRANRIVPGLVSLASISIHIDSVVNSFTYFRPSLRHWFEGGWSLDDIDIGHLIARLSVNRPGRDRLAASLKLQ